MPVRLLIQYDNIYQHHIHCLDMNNPLISTRVPVQLYEDAEKITHDRGFGSVQEFVRHALREQILIEKRRKAASEIEKLVGSISEKDVKNLSHQKREELALKLFPPE